MDALIQSVLGKFDIVSLVQAVSRCQMKRATAEIISIKCGTNKANHKHTQKKINYKVTKRSGKFIITVKHFRALEMRCKCCCYTMYKYILYLCFYFHLAERQNLDDCVFLSFSHALSFRFVCTKYTKKDKLGRYFTRIWTRTKQRNTHTQMANLNEDLLLIHCTQPKILRDHI